MKRLCLIALALLLCLGLASCTGRSSTYRSTVKELEGLSPSYYWNDTNVKEQNAKAKELYDHLLSLDGYKNSAEYLARFTVIPDALLLTTTSQTDAFGQTSEYSRTNVHLYSSYGERVDACELFELIGASWDSYEHPLACLSYEYEYDKDGAIKSIAFRSEVVNKILCKTTLERDNRGNIISATTLTASGEKKTSTYTYTEQNLLFSAKIYRFRVTDHTINLFESDIPAFYHYVYDQDGRLIETAFDGKSSWRIHYEYDENGRLIEAGDTRYEYDAQGVLLREITSGEQKEYTYHEDGKIATVTTTAADGKTYTETHHYGTLYLYFPEK